jgi:hypothetical protein
MTKINVATGVQSLVDASPMGRPLNADRVSTVAAEDEADIFASMCFWPTRRAGRLGVDSLAISIGTSHGAFKFLKAAHLIAGTGGPGKPYFPSGLNGPLCLDKGPNTSGTFPVESKVEMCIWSELAPHERAHDHRTRLHKEPESARQDGCGRHSRSACWARLGRNTNWCSRHRLWHILLPDSRLPPRQNQRHPLPALTILSVSWARNMTSPDFNRFGGLTSPPATGHHSFVPLTRWHWDKPQRQVRSCLCFAVPALQRGGG